MRFFFDNNLSSHLAGGMKEFGEDVVHLREHFPENAADAEWLPFVGDNGLVLITRDDAIRWNPAEFKPCDVTKSPLSSSAARSCRVVSSSSSSCGIGRE